MTSTADKITAVCNDVRDMLLAKNLAYGDSASNPLRVFSKADKLEAIRVRIDDKLSRISRGEGYPGDNDVKDLVGYLLLYLANDGTDTPALVEEAPVEEAPVEEAPVEEAPVPSEWTLRWDRHGDLWGELDGDFWVWGAADNSPGDHRQPPCLAMWTGGWEKIERSWGPLEEVEATELSRADEVARRYAGRGALLDEMGRVWEDKGGPTLYLVENAHRQPRDTTAAHWTRNYVERTFGTLTPVEQ